MNIGVDPGSATLAGVGVAPSLKDGAAPAASSRQAAHFQSLVDGRTGAGRREAVKEPASRDAGRHTPAVRGGTSAPARPATATTPKGATRTSPTHTAPHVVTARPAAARPDTSSEDPSPETPAADEAASDSAVLGALAAMFGTPAPVAAAVPAESASEEQGSIGIGNDDPAAQAPQTIDMSKVPVDEATTAPSDAETTGADAVTAQMTPSAIPVDGKSVAARRDAAQLDTRPAGQAAKPVGVAPVQSAAARALARALGALTGETAPSIAPPPVTQPAGPADLSPAGPLASPDDAAVESANARRSVAAKGIVAQPMTDGLETPVPQAFAEPSDVSVEGALRKASAAAQGRELASAATPRAAEVTAPQTLGASILDASVRVEGIAVQPAQGGQQASIGLAPAITDNGLDREGTVAEQLVKAVRIHVRDGIGEARLTLRPEHMGEVSVQLKIDKDRVSATLLVERSDVRAQIEGQGAALRAGLEAQGLKLEEFVVREDGERRKGSDQDGQREQSGRRRRPASDKSFDLNDA